MNIRIYAKVLLYQLASLHGPLAYYVACRQKIGQKETIDTLKQHFGNTASTIIRLNHQIKHLKK